MHRACWTCEIRGGNSRSGIQVYSRDRALAARDFPASEIYLAFDGGSGYDFWLPHVSPNDSEVPSKALDKAHTQPLKVMNGPPRMGQSTIRLFDSPE
jgi:hypothetical protein